MALCIFYIELLLLCLSLLWIHIVLKKIAVFKQPRSVICHWNQDDDEILKSVDHSVYPFVRL